MRCLVLSDIHSNLEALEAVLKDAGPVDQTWCLGDLVGYGPDPNACVELLSSRSRLSIAGNHDWATLRRLDLGDFNLDARLANLWNRAQLTPANLSFLERLPQTIVEGQFTLAHGSPCHPIWEYLVYPESALASFGCFESSYCLVGHTHVPAVFRLAEEPGAERCELVSLSRDGTFSLGAQRLILNPGSVGQPRDGDPRASYALLDMEAMTWEQRRVPYQLEVTQQKMTAHYLPRRLVLRLAHGW
jgi:predicted phosphodiesterase